MNIIKFYICNGRMPCAYTKNGKKNEYCNANGMHMHCKYTTDLKFARYKAHTEFDEKGPYIVDGVETMYLWEKERR